MYGNQLLRGTTVAVAVSILLLLGFAGAATADEHVDRSYDLDEGESVIVPYTETVSIFSEEFEGTSDAYIVEVVELSEDYDEETMEMMTVSEEQTYLIPNSTLERQAVPPVGEQGLLVDSALFSQFADPEGEGPFIDPQGEYLVREPIMNPTVDVSDQHPQAPSELDVAITDSAVDGSILTLMTETNAEDVTADDYSWVAEVEGEVTEIENNLTLLEDTEDRTILYQNIDGEYTVPTDDTDLEEGQETIYPGTFEILSPEDLDADVDLIDGEVMNLDRDVTEGESFVVEYVDVSSSTFDEDIRLEEDYDSGDTVDTGFDFLIERPDVSLETEQRVQEDYEFATETTEETENLELTDGPVFTVEEESDVVPDSITVEDTEGNDVLEEVIAVNHGDEEIVLETTEETIEVDITYDVVTEREAADDIVIDSAETASDLVDNEHDLEENVIVEIEESEIQESLFTVETVELEPEPLAQENYVLDWSPAVLAEDTLTTATFEDDNFGIETEDVTEDLEDVDLESGEFVVPFDVQHTEDPGQTLVIDEIEFYENSESVEETIVEENEYGANGVFEIDDERTDRFDTMELIGVEGDLFEASVEDAEQFTVSVDEVEPTLTEGNVELDSYTYDVDETEEFPEAGEELNYEIAHDPDQTTHTFEVTLDTVEGEVTDTFVLENPEDQPEGSVETGLDTVVVDEANVDTGVPYQLRVVDESSGVTLGEQSFGDGVQAENARISLSDDLEDGQDLSVEMYRPDPHGSGWVPMRGEMTDLEDGSVDVTEPVSETLSIDSSEQSTFPDESFSSPEPQLLAQEWTLTSGFDQGERNEADQRVYTDRLNTGEEPSGPLSIPMGAELVVSGNEFDQGDELTLRPQEEEELEIPDVELTVEQSETVNEGQIVIDTTLPEATDDPSLIAGTNFEVVTQEDEELVFSYGTTDVSLSADVEPDFIDLLRDTSAELNLESNLNVDVELQLERGEEEEVDPEDVIDLFEPATQDAYDMEVRDDHVRAFGITDESLEMDLDVVPEDYTFVVTEVESEVTNAASFTVDEGPEGELAFEQGTFNVAQGDTATIEMTTDNVSEFTFSIEENYDFEMGIAPEDEEIVIEMDTYLADGVDAAGESVTVDDVFSVEDGEILGDPELPSDIDSFDTSNYKMEAQLTEAQTDTSATLSVDEREFEDVSTWVQPTTAVNQVDLDTATPQENVVDEDALLLEIELSGFDSEELITDDTHPEMLVDPHERAELDPAYDTAEEFVEAEIETTDSVAKVNQMNLSLTGEDPTNRPEPHVLVEEANDLITVAPDESDGDTGTALVLFEVEEELFDNFNEEVSVEQDRLAEYDIEFTATEDYKVVDESETMEEEVELHERRVQVTMPTSEVGESPQIDTRYIAEPLEESEVLAETYIAPQTDVSVQLVDDSEAQDEVPDVALHVSDTATVQEVDERSQNALEFAFDLEEYEEGRLAQFEYLSVDQDDEPFVVGEEVEEEPPVISDLTFDFSGEDPRVGDEISFEADIENVDPAALEYDWGFGDGNTSALIEPVHSYDSQGTYEITLTVTDPSTGESDTETAEIVVLDELRTAPEIIDVVAPEDVLVGEEANFGVVATDAEASVDELNYEWDFGDGTTGTGITATHTYSLPDLYTVEVTVTDPEDEELSDTEDVLVSVDEEEEETELEVSAIDSETNDGIPSANIDLQDTDTGDSVDTAQTNVDGVHTFTGIDETEYAVTVSASDYETSTETVDVDGQTSITVELNPEDDGENGNDNGDGNDDPDQPGFTLIALLIAIMGLVGYYLYRRRSGSN